MPFRMTSNIKETQVRLKAVAPLAALELKKTLRQEASPILASARAKAAAIPTKTGNHIPQAIHVSVLQTGVAIRVSASESKVGTLHEKSRGHWRHPVFGNREKWVQQKAFPFVKPAILANAAVIEVRMRTAIEVAGRKAGFS